MYCATSAEVMLIQDQAHELFCIGAVWARGKQVGNIVTTGSVEPENDAPNEYIGYYIIGPHASGKHLAIWQSILT